MNVSQRVPVHTDGLRLHRTLALPHSEPSPHPPRLPPLTPTQVAPSDVPVIQEETESLMPSTLLWPMATLPVRKEEVTVWTAIQFSHYWLLKNEPSSYLRCALLQVSVCDTTPRPIPPPPFSRKRYWDFTGDLTREGSGLCSACEQNPLNACFYYGT